MNKYEQLIEENQRFWESLDIEKATVDASSFTALASEDDYLQELALEALTLDALV